MNSQYEHFAAVSRVAAVRQVRERQLGADCSAGYFSVAGNMGIAGDTLSVVSVFRAPEPNGKAQYVTTLVRDNHRYSLWMETQGHFYCGTGGGAQSLHLGDLPAGTDHLVALCRDGDILYCYLDGELKGTLGVYDFKAADGFFVGRAAINQDTLFTSTIYGAKIFNYTLSADEVSTLYNDGDPAGYVLPGWYKRAEEVIDLAPLNNWTLAGNASYNPDTGEFHIISDGSAAGVIPVTSAKEQLYRTDLIYKVKFKAKGNGALSLTNNGRIRPISRGSMFRPDSVTEYTEYVALIAFEGVDQLFFKRGSTGEWYIRDIEISAAGCVAEYLPQNITTSGPGELGAVKITGNNSYTWTGADDATFSKIITTSRPPVFGQWYRIEGVISNYEAGVPNVSADTGFTEYPLPQANGNFSVLVRCKNANASPYSFLFRGGARGTNRLLSVEINSIEPVNNVASSWLDSAKQLPLNDEYLPPLLEPIVIGDATPMQITGDNSYTWVGTESPYNSWVRVAKPFIIGTTYRINITVSNYESGSPFVWLGSSVNIPAANGTYDILLPSSVSQSHLLIYGGPSGSDRCLTLTVNKIEPVPERGYDLTASGTPKIVYKLTQLVLASPDLMDDGTGHSRPYIGLYFNSAQPDASYLRVNGKIVADVGSSVPTNRPMVIYYRFNFIPGHFYRLTIRWSLISGSYFIEAFGDWSTDTYTYSGDTKHNIPGSYEYTIPLMKAKEGLVNYYRPTVFFGTSEANSRFSIDEIIIEEYV